MDNLVDIRRVMVGDERVLAFIQTESWKIAFHQILTPELLEKSIDIKKAEAMYAMLLEKNVGNGLILSVDGEPHCIAYWDKARDIDESDCAELICIHSLYSNWGKGYGSMMMDYILDDINKAGFLRVILWVFEENIRARKFYEKHGFTITDTTKLFGDAVEVMYSKALT